MTVRLLYTSEGGEGTLRKCTKVYSTAVLPWRDGSGKVQSTFTEATEATLGLFSTEGGGPYSSSRTTRSCRHKALSCRPIGLRIEKDLAGPKARLTLVECFPVERRGCGAPPKLGVELPLPILRYPSHNSYRPHLNGGGAEQPRSEGWSFPCLFCSTQVTRVRIDGGVV